ncbi:MAG: hypothetical protein ABJ275_06430 [Maricaulaceae bacterium]
MPHQRLLTHKILAPFLGEQDGLFAISRKYDSTYPDAGIADVNRSPYLGSEDTEDLIFPYVRDHYKGHLFINPATDAGACWRNIDNLRLSISVN